MRSTAKFLFYTCTACAIAHGGAASAQTYQQQQTYQTTPPPTTTTTTTTTEVETEPGMFNYTWYDERMQTGVGVAVTIGGGVVGFTDGTMRDTTAEAGGLWDLRVTLGSHVPLGLDVNYIGTATSIDGLPTGQEGTLIGTTLEGALRFNILPQAAWNPYLFGGVGWQRYDVTETEVRLSDSGMADSDNLLEFPMGAGISYRTGGLVADLRGTFRLAYDEDMVIESISTFPTTGEGNFAEMHTWQASAALGYEF